MLLYFSDHEEQVVKVILQKALSLPHMDGSLVFNSWRQYAPPLNTCFLGLTRVPVSNGIWIGSAIFAGLTVVTGRQTNHDTRSVTIARICVYRPSTVMRPNNTMSYCDLCQSVIFMCSYVFFLYYVGIASNTMIAKVCSDKNKPNGQFLVAPSAEAMLSFMHDLPIRKVCFFFLENVLHMIRLVNFTNLSITSDIIVARDPE